MNVPPWKPLNPLVVNAADCRSAAAYRDVLDQFDVLHADRYKAAGGKTFCNIYVWDCTSALGCEIPHWTNADRAPCKPGMGNEMSANALMDWMHETGKTRGWRECDSFDAAKGASSGHPTVALYRNPGGHGHIAMVLPGPNGTCHIAQAGRVNLFDVPLQAGFGSKVPVFFTHL